MTTHLHQTHSDTTIAELARLELAGGADPHGPVKVHLAGRGGFIRYPTFAAIPYDSFDRIEGELARRSQWELWMLLRRDRAKQARKG